MGPIPDGDCILDSKWIDTAVSFLESNAEFAVACGRRREIDPETSIYNRLIDMEWDTPVGEAKACGGDALMRVKAFYAGRWLQSVAHRRGRTRAVCATATGRVAYHAVRYRKDEA